jgi:hypothetical protein
MMRYATLMLLIGMSSASAQNSPGPTNPAPQTNTQAKPGATMVINPTQEECRRGWNVTLRWTKEQFEQFCAQLRASK